MDKSEGKDWFAKTLNNVTEETAKVYKISRLKLDIASVNKTKNEKMNLLSRKLLDLIKNGKVDASLFEPEYTTIKGLDEKKALLEQEAENIKNSMKIGFGKKPQKTAPGEKEPNDVIDEKKLPVITEDQKRD